MNKEINEILEDLKDKESYITQEEAEILYDYITNLQEEKDMYKVSFEEMSKNYFEEQLENILNNKI